MMVKPPKTRRRLSREAAAAIVRDYQGTRTAKPITIREAAERQGVAYSTAHRALVVAGVERRTRAGKARTTPDAE